MAFSRAGQAAAFAGLVPRQHVSGTSVRGRSTLCKMGRSRLRKALFFPAMVALQHNPLVRALGERLTKAGKSKMLIVGAAMRKLIQISTFYRNDKPNGVGVTLPRELGDLDKVLNDLTTNYDLMWRQSVYESDTAQLVMDLIQQLEAIGMTKDFTIHLGLLAVGNVYLLEKVGHLKPDEFNGLQLVYMNL